MIGGGSGAATEAEAMVDSRQAATALQVPYYWLADRQMRNELRIPHFALGGLVRYRLTELCAWAVQHSTARVRDENARHSDKVAP